MCNTTHTTATLHVKAKFIKWVSIFIRIRLEFITSALKLRQNCVISCIQCSFEKKNRLL